MVASDCYLANNLQYRYPKKEIFEVDQQIIQALNYFQTCINTTNFEESKTTFILTDLSISQMYIEDIDVEDPQVDIFRGDQLVFSTTWDNGKEQIWDSDSGALEINDLKLSICGDLTIVCYEIVMKEDMKEETKKTILSYWIHTAFINKGDAAVNVPVGIIELYNDD